VQGALVDEVEARFVAVHEAEGRGGGEGGEGGGHAVDGIGFTGGKITGGKTAGDGVIEHAGFEGPSAAHTPTGGGHLLDHAELHAIGGLEAVHVLGQMGFERFARFILHHDTAGEESVADGVLGRTLLPLGCNRSASAGSVGARSQNTSKRRHSISLQFQVSMATQGNIRK